MSSMKFSQHRHAWQRQALAPAPIKTWLKDTGSLTARLQARYPDFAVQVISLSLASAHVDECAMLDLRRHVLASTREVLLMGDQQALVYAHSVLPTKSLRGPWHDLKRLGGKPLGASLFANPKVKRGPLSYKKLSSKHPLAQKIQAIRPQSVLWARRSIFQLGRASILVTEVMLPPLLHSSDNLES